MHEQRQTLIHYIIPSLLGNISMFILTIVDGMFVGNGVGLFSTKRTPYAIALNVCRSIVFNSLCINILPRLLGYNFVWYTVAVAEGVCFIIAVLLKNVSERNGIVYR